MRLGTLTPEMGAVLRAMVRSRLNLLISGGTGSGKTTLLNCLSSFIPDQERIVTIEDSAELQLQQPHVCRLETRPPNIEGRGEVTQRDLVRNCLRMRPDRIIVGEVRGPESLDMLQAMNTGHDGSISTIHANTPRDSLSRLEMMMQMSGFTLPNRAMRQQISSALDLIVSTARLPDGSRIGFLNAILQRLALTKNLVRVIRQAGLKRRVGEVLLYMPLLAAAAFLLVTFVLGKPLFAVVAAVVAGLTPLMIVLQLRRKRLALFSEQLPDGLDLIRAALQAGHGFLSALQVGAEEFPDPIAGEFTEVAEEIRLGLTVREALQHLIERVEDPNLPILAAGVVITQEVGGNLAEVLNNISYTIRERFKLLREVRVLTAQGRLSGLVLTALPFLVAVALILFNPEYFRPMMDSKQGLYMMGYGILSIALGHLVIQRIVRIKV